MFTEKKKQDGSSTDAIGDGDKEGGLSKQDMRKWVLLEQ